MWFNIPVENLFFMSKIQGICRVNKIPNRLIRGQQTYSVHEIFERSFIRVSDNKVWVFFKLTGVFYIRNFFKTMPVIRDNMRVAKMRDCLRFSEEISLFFWVVYECCIQLNNNK